jgi:hypothetical protein
MAKFRLEAKAIGVKESEERLKALEADIPKVMFDSVRKSTLIAERAVKLQIKTRMGWRARTGTFAASFTSAALVEKVGGNSAVIGVVGSAHPASRIQERGGTIRAKRTRNLAIPISDLARKRRPRDFPDLFVVVSKKGKGQALLARAIGTNADGSVRLEFHYVLKPSVRLKKTRYFSKAIAGVEGEIIALVGGRIGVVVGNS